MRLTVFDGEDIPEGRIDFAEQSLMCYTSASYHFAKWYNLLYHSANNCKTAEQIFLKQPLGAKKAAAEISQECEAKIFLQKNFLALD